MNQRDVELWVERELEAHKIREREMKNRVATYVWCYLFTFAHIQLPFEYRYESRLSQTNTRLRVTEKLSEELRSRVRERSWDESKRLSRFRASALSDVGMKRSRALLTSSLMVVKRHPCIVMLQ